MDRFAEKVDFGNFDGCWNWTGHIDCRGYGRFSLSGGRTQVMHAARAGWLLWVGSIPDGMETDHLCHNGACVNPDHLELVTHGENLRRRRSGVCYGNAWSRQRVE